MKQLQRYVTVLLLVAGSLVAHAQSSLEGKWRGMEGNVPNVDLSLQQKDGHATGSFVFYMLKKDDENSAPRVEGQAAGVMENVHYEPAKLTFDLHRRNGSVATFRLELIDTNHARLFRTSDTDENGQGVVLARVE